jgi:predicted ATPase/DNA-binding CsgD family transcriptional regulator/DNA-binding XRE family transcriptional regulator
MVGPAPTDTGTRPTFGAALKRYRIAAGLSQEALAELAGVSARAISAYERGVREAPYRDTVGRLATALSLSPRDRALLEATVTRGRGPRLTVEHPDDELARTIASRRTNLPVQVTSFVGRQRETAEVMRLLEQTRLLTLTGTGGCGKTRLALEVAASLLDSFSDGVLLVDLAPVHAGNLVPYALAAALGRRERSGEALMDSLVRYLSPRELLLVLDNCEHLIEPSASLAERVLKSCPRVRLLATSREPLRIGGETTWRVPSLAGPDPRTSSGSDDLLTYPAVRLFVDRAQAVKSSFSLDAANATPVARVCARLEGLPLALELAAACVPVLAMPQILERLDDSFNLLVGGSRTAPTRQQTLRATLDWSHGLLTPQERLVFRRLAVFAGDYSLEAAEAVCAAGDVPGTAVLGLLQRLIDKSLVIADEKSGRSRYRLLEPVRQYAHGLLVATCELADVRRRHAMFFLDFGEARERATNVGGPERTTAAAALLQEYPNIRLALGWCVEAQEGQLGLRLARTVQFLWQARGYPSEGSVWLERLLALPGASEPTPARVVCLLTAGRLASLLGRTEAARALHEAALPLARTISDPWVQWLGPQNFGIFALACGDLETAARYFREALAIARAANDQVDEALSLGAVATTALQQGNYDQARQLAEDARRIAHAAGEEWAEGQMMQRLGELALLRGDHETARIDLAHALDMFRRQGNPQHSALALEGLGRVALAKSNRREAFAYLAQSLRLLDDIGNRKDLVECLESFAALAAAQSMTEVALQLAGAAVAIRESIGAVQSPFRRDLLERSLSVAPGGVTDHIYAHAWQAGRELTIQEAIALALSIQPSGARDSTTSARNQDLQLVGLTAREALVLRLVARGQSNKEIAAELVLSVRTVERHITNLYGKIDARGKADATAYAIRHGLA